ncbi:MAG TPA: hypothetical protein VFR47_31315 [Anaerolineales bacterium]|nr:hypothetical protein [Anaerolineales bacterium]
MTNVLKYSLAYVLWIVDLALGLWLVFISRTAFLDILALFYKPGAWVYSRRVDLADKAFVLILGLGWLIFMIFIEHYYRANAFTGELPKRFARVTGLLLLCIFAVDMVLVWVQGVGNSNWLRWFILAVELAIGTVLMVTFSNKFATKN